VERKKEQNFLKTPLTLVLSRKGREEMEGKILKDPSPLPSPAVGRGEKEDEKILTAPLTLPSPAVGRGEKEDEKI
jgi:hypothetical protein